MYIQETISYVGKRGRCITNDQIVMIQELSSDYHQNISNLHLHNSNSTDASCNFYKRFPHYI